MRFLALVLSVLLLTSCTFSISAEDLLSPPKMSSSQEEIYRALESAVGTSSFKFKYPRRGEYLSAVIMYDIDNDGTDEAFAFYELENNNSFTTWISFLTFKDGHWQSVREIPAASSDIDMVSFANITDSNREDIIVGWSLPGEDYSSCCIYSFDGSDAEKIHDVELPYSEMLIENVDDNMLKEIVLATKTNTRSQMRLVKFRAGKIVTVGLISMPENIKEYKQLKFGKLTEGLNCVFADVLLSSGMTETKLISVDNSTIEDISPEDIGIYDSFKRNESPFLCMDVNYDGQIDIPVTMPSAGSDDLISEEIIYITKYVTFKDGELIEIMNLIYNDEDGYFLKIPNTWVNHVAVRRQNGTGEWKFYIYNKEDASAEILRINTTDVNEYQDKLQIDYQTLAIQGSRRYLCYIPDTIYPGYSVTFEELKDMFHLGTDMQR